MGSKEQQAALPDRPALQVFDGQLTAGADSDPPVGRAYMGACGARLRTPRLQPIRAPSDAFVDQRDSLLVRCGWSGHSYFPDVVSLIGTQAARYLKTHLFLPESFLKTHPQVDEFENTVFAL